MCAFTHLPARLRALVNVCTITSVQIHYRAHFTKEENEIKGLAQSPAPLAAQSHLESSPPHTWPNVFSTTPATSVLTQCWSHWFTSHLKDMPIL